MYTYMRITSERLKLKVHLTLFSRIIIFYFDFCNIFIGTVLFPLWIFLLTAI